MNDPANAALKSHKLGYLQGPGAPLCGGVALIFLLTNDLSRAGGPTERTDLSDPSCQSCASEGSKQTLQPWSAHSPCPTGECKLETLTLTDTYYPGAQACSPRSHEIETELNQNLRNCRNPPDDVICVSEALVEEAVSVSPVFAFASCVSTDSLFSQHRADIFIGPEITYGTGCWLLWGWTSEQVDRSPASADAFAGHIWPACGTTDSMWLCLRSTEAFFQWLALGWITPPQTLHLWIDVDVVQIWRPTHRMCIYSVQTGNS